MNCIRCGREIKHGEPYYTSHGPRCKLCPIKQYEWIAINEEGGEVETDSRIVKEAQEAIFKVFDKYEFKDREGNDLRYCQDFIDLVDLVI